MNTKVAIITGAASGIGRGITQRLAKDGFSVALYDINGSGLDETNQLIGSHVDSLLMTGDVRDEQAVKRMVKATVERFGSIDALITAAGINEAAPAVDTDLSVWNRVIGINLTGTFLFCREVAPHMMQQRSGRIVTIGSLSGKEGVPLTSAYCASKFAVHGFTDTLGVELGQYGITVNCVCPGPTDTIQIQTNWPKRAKKAGMTLEAYAEKINNSIPLGRITKVEDVAGAVAFFLSPDASYLTRIFLDVSGGLRTIGIN